MIKEVKINGPKINKNFKNFLSLSTLFLALSIFPSSRGFAGAIESSAFNFNIVADPLGQYSTGSYWKDGLEYNHKLILGTKQSISDDPTENKIGEFTISPTATPLSTITSMSITFSMFDGDSGLGDIDRDDLVLTLGNNVGDKITFENLFLNDFSAAERGEKVTNSLDFSSDLTLALQYSDLVSNAIAADKILNFYITDLDGGENQVYFRDLDLDSGDFNVSVTAAPEPMTLGLFGMALFALGVYKRKLVKQTSSIEA